MSGFVKITPSGENFIKTLSGGSSKTSWVKGNNGTFPYSDGVSPDKIWVSNSKNQNGVTITNNEQVAEALIYYYNYYCEIYGLDANVLAAQAYQESKFQIWIYNNSTSTASGLVQFLVTAICDVIFANNHGILPKFTEAELERLNVNLPYPIPIGSGALSDDYSKVGSNRKGRANREQLHQNFIDNLDLMIKAQCRYMKLCANRANNIAASALFGYNRGPFGYIGKTYKDSVNLATPEYAKEGLGYVWNIFGYLGDTNNTTVFLNRKSYAYLEGLSFGYDKKLKLTEKYEPVGKD
jgi:hypothetical protein